MTTSPTPTSPTAATSPSPTSPTGRSSRRRMTAVAAGLAVTVGALAVAPTASAATTTEPSSETAELNARLERACLRIPNMTIRTERAIERINGDADTRGSLLWLDERIARAEENGQEDRVEVLTNRRAVREATVPVLEQRLDTLASLADRCRDAGVDL